MSETPSWSFETKQIHAGQAPDTATGARAAADLPDHVSYVFDNTDHAANLFGLKEFGNIYTRIMNPTADAVEQRVAALEGGVGALLVASGQAARDARPAQHRRGRRPHRGQPQPLRRHRTTCCSTRFPRLGIEVTFVEDPTSLDSWRAAVRPNTKVFFGETIANPKAEVLDIEGVAALAHEHGVPLVVDNTIATPYLIRPLEWGADVVVHSATKYLGGHGTSIAGVIVDAGNVRLRRRPGEVPRLQHPGRELPRARLRPRPRRRQPARRQPRLHPQGAGAAAARPRPGGVAVQRLPHRPGHRDAARCASSGTSRTPAKVAAYLQGHDAGRAGRLGLPAREPVVRAGAEVRPARRRRGRSPSRSRAARGGQEVRRGADAAQPRRQHRRRALARHPPRLDDALARRSTRTAWPPASRPGWCASSVGMEHIDDIIADLEQGFAAAKA